jgi:hypothetical protein
MTRFARTRTTIRVLAAIFLGYFAAAGLAALVAVVTVAWTGISRVDAMVVIGSYSYVAWVGFFLWAFAARRIAPMLAILTVVAICGHWAAALIERSLPVTGAS